MYSVMYNTKYMACSIRRNHATLNKYWFNVRAPSTTLANHSTSTCPILLFSGAPVVQCVYHSKQKNSITFVQCWTNVEDVGPALYKCYKNVLYLVSTAHSITLVEACHIFRIQQHNVCHSIYKELYTKPKMV